MVSAINFVPSTEKLNEQKFVIKPHVADILNQLNKFRKSEKYCDATLISEIDSERINVHKSVLIACSDYFLSLFSKSLCAEFFITGVNGNILNQLVDFCYTGAISVNTDNVEELLRSACSLQLSHVVDVCVRFIRNRLEITNCLDILILADQLKCEKLSENVYEFISRNLADVAKSDKLQQINSKQLCNLVARDDLELNAQKDVLKIIMAWINFDKINRVKYISGFLSVIRLRNIPMDFISTELKTVFKSHDCEALYLERLIKHLESVISKMDQTSSEELPCRYNVTTDVLKAFDKSLRLKKLCNITDFYTKVSEGYKNLNLFHYGKFLCFNSEKPTEKETCLWEFERGTNYGKIFSLNGCIYILGSCDKQTKQSIDPVLKNLFSDTDIWEEPDALSYFEFRINYGAVSLGNSLYVIGGMHSNNALNLVECYEQKTNSWMKLAPMIENRISPGAVRDKNYIYVFGGSNLNGILKSVERYDPQINKWTMMQSLNFPKVPSQCAVFDDEIYVADMQSDFLPISSLIVEVYNIKTDKWASPLNFQLTLLFLLLLIISIVVVLLFMVFKHEPEPEPEPESISETLKSIFNQIKTRINK